MPKKLKKYINKYLFNPVLSGFIGGLFTGLIYIGIFPGALAPILLVGLVYLLLGNSTKQALKAFLIQALAWFAIFHAFVLSWMLKSDISEATGFTNFSAKLAVIFSWALMVAVTTTVMMLLPTAVYFVRRNWLKKDGLLLFGSLATFWVVAEYLRSIVFGAFLFGPGGTVGDFWSFGSLGLATVNSPIAGLASVVGLYGLSFLVISLAIGLYQLLVRRKFSVLLITVVLLLAVGLVARLQYSGQAADGQKSIEVSVLSQQDDNNQPDNMLPIEPYRDTQKDLIVLPEYSEVSLHGQSKQSEQQIQARLGEAGISLDVEEKKLSDDQKFASMTVKDANGDVQGEQTKQFLIPTGEYMPYIFRWFFSGIDQSKIVDEYDSNQALNKGQAPVVIKSDKVSVGAIACSGILNRQAYRQLTGQGAEVLASNASLVIFNGSRVYFDQSLSMAKFHAIANQRPFIQATKAAPSFVLDAKGGFVLKPVKVVSQFSDVVVVPSSKQTIFTRFGEIILYISALFSVFVLSFTFKRVKVSRSKNSKH